MHFNNSASLVCIIALAGSSLAQFDTISFPSGGSSNLNSMLGSNNMGNFGNMDMNPMFNNFFNNGGSHNNYRPQQNNNYQPQQNSNNYRPQQNNNYFPQQNNNYRPQQNNNYRPQPIQEWYPSQPNGDNNSGNYTPPQSGKKPNNTPPQSGTDSSNQPNYQQPQNNSGGGNSGNGQCNKLGDLPTKANFEVEMNKYATGIPKGQCTEWADGRYYQLTGKHALFNGDAHRWNELASDTPGWTVSNTPSVPSIVVIEQNTNGAGSAGHVAIVESMSGDTFCTSNWNSPSLGTLTFKSMKVGPGISFIKYNGN